MGSTESSIKPSNVLSLLHKNPEFSNFLQYMTSNFSGREAQRILRFPSFRQTVAFAGIREFGLYVGPILSPPWILWQHCHTEARHVNRRNVYCTWLTGGSPLHIFSTFSLIFIYIIYIDPQRGQFTGFFFFFVQTMKEVGLIVLSVSILNIFFRQVAMVMISPSICHLTRCTHACSCFDGFVAFG